MKHAVPGCFWRQSLAVFRRQVVKATFVFAAVVAAAIGYTLWPPLLYVSEAKIFVRLGRETVALDPTATTGQTIAVQESRENEINSVQELFKSRAILEALVDGFGPAAILNVASVGEVVSPGEPSIWQRLNPMATYSPRDKAIRLLGKRFNAEAVRKSNVINVSCEAPSPELAQRLVARAIEAARAIHVRVNRSAESFEFFTSQAHRQDGKLAKLEEELHQLKDATGIAAIDPQRTILLERLAALEADRLRAQAAFDSAEAEVASRSDAVRDMPAMQVSSETTGQAQTAASRLREQLYALELHEKELASKYQEDTFVVRQVRQQIVDAKRVLAQEVEPVQTTTSLNESHQQSSVALVENRAKSAALAAQVKTLDAQVAAAQRSLEAFNAAEVKMAQLERQIDLEKTAFLRFAENRELARIDRELQDQNISNLNVLQSPTYSPTPTKPRTMLNLIFGLALASIAAVAAAGLSEVWRQSARPDQRSFPDESTWIGDEGDDEFASTDEGRDEAIFEGAGARLKKTLR